MKECTAWKREIRELWAAVGEASGGRTGDPLKSKKGFGYRVRQARARPSKTSIRDLLSNDRYTGAVLAFLEATRVGEIGRVPFVDKTWQDRGPTRVSARDGISLSFLLSLFLSFFSLRTSVSR